MNRQYDEGERDDIIFFIGTEIEKTQCYGLKTLFVVGIQNDEEIINLAEKYKCKHVYLAANHSFETIMDYGLDEGLGELEDYIIRLTKKFKVTVDVPLFFYDLICAWWKKLKDNDNFFVNISVEIEDVQTFKNVSVKVDDSDFDNTNPGVWVYQLEDRNFTPWSEYKNDVIINKTGGKDD